VSNIDKLDVSFFLKFNKMKRWTRNVGVILVVCLSLCLCVYSEESEEEDLDRATLLKEEGKSLINQFTLKTNEIKESLRLKFQSRLDGIAPVEKSLEEPKTVEDLIILPTEPVQTEEEKLAEFINNIIQSNLIVVFGMSYCP
jgi:hypothetical protein